MKQIPVEILAPAGSYESMVAAIHAGADAVYIGGSRFGARAFANNLDEGMMLQAIDYAHLHGCHLYMTVNTLLKEEELSQLCHYLKPYYERGLDAVIVQDMGAFAVIRREFPDLPIHASTQMTVTGVHGARVLAALGAQRVVTARELSLEEIKEIHDNLDIEIESFVHGALCYCYSGQCLYSSLVGGRSGNRGRCAQPCRLPYDVKRDGRILNKQEERHVLSLKDLCTLSIIPDIIEAGVFSLKIEGRMKSPRYTAGVVSIYRKYVDAYLKHGREGYQVDQRDEQMLLDLFDRGGLTDGYYQKHNGPDMTALREKPSFREGNEELFRYLDETYILKKSQKPVDGCLLIEEGKKSCLKVTCDGLSVTTLGDMPAAALNQPVTQEKLEKQMKKTGNTPFFFQTLEIQITGKVFMPVQSLNELRRKALEDLEQELLKSFRREQPPAKEKVDCLAETQQRWQLGQDNLNHDAIHVSIEDLKLLSVCLSCDDVSEIYLGSDIEPGRWRESVNQCHQSGKSCLLMMPHIFRNEAKRYFDKNLSLLKDVGFDGLVIRSLEEVDYLKQKNIPIPMVFDYTMYQWNHMAKKMWESLGAVRLTMPLELNSRELEKSCCHEELVVYGYLPMMVTAQCIQKTVQGCNRSKEVLMIKDRMGKEFPVKNHCDFCYNTIYNTSPLSLLGHESIISRLNPSSVRLQFTVETQKQAQQILEVYCDSFLRGETRELPFTDFTRGHFKRGVE